MTEPKARGAGSSQRARPTLLVGLTAAVYATSFIRERFLLQAALGSAALDGAVTYYGIAAMLGNLWAVSVSLAWIDGRAVRPVFRGFAFVLALGIALAPLSAVLGGSVALVGLVGAFEYHRQRAAFAGQQSLALGAALVAPFVSMLAWSTLGVDSPARIVAGYGAGLAFQAAAAVVAGRTAAPRRARSDGLGVSLIWPVLFALVTQLNTLIDRLLLVLVGVGWPAASTFAVNIATAIMLIVVGPLSSEAVAGRLRAQPSGRVLVASALCAIVGAAVAPAVLPLLIAGDQVTGGSYEKVRDQTILYILSIPGAGYWLFRARALQTGSHMWRPVAVSALVLLAVHVAIAVPSAVTGLPLGPAVGWVVSAYVGALILWSVDSPNRKQMSSRRQGVRLRFWPF